MRVAVRERGASRFGAPQTVESPRFGCGSTGALLRALPADGLAVLYQGGSYDFPPLLARVATAARGQRFGAPATLASDARADAAVVTASGQLVTALLRRTVQPEVFTGAVSVLRSTGAEELVDAGPASSPLLSVDRAGMAVLAWRSGADAARRRRPALASQRRRAGERRRRGALVVEALEHPRLARQQPERERRERDDRAAEQDVRSRRAPPPPGRRARSRAA